MSTYAVALINHLNDEGDLRLKVVTAGNWRNALEAAFPGYLENIGDTMDVDVLEVAKTVAHNQDWEFDVVKVV